MYKNLYRTRTKAPIHSLNLRLVEIQGGEISAVRKGGVSLRSHRMHKHFPSDSVLQTLHFPDTLSQHTEAECTNVNCAISEREIPIPNWNREQRHYWCPKPTPAPTGGVWIDTELYTYSLHLRSSAQLGARDQSKFWWKWTKRVKVYSVTLPLRYCQYSLLQTILIIPICSVCALFLYTASSVLLSSPHLYECALWGSPETLRSTSAHPPAGSQGSISRYYSPGLRKPPGRSESTMQFKYSLKVWSSPWI